MWNCWTLGEDGIRPCYFYSPGGDKANIGVVVSATWGEKAQHISQNNTWPTGPTLCRCRAITPVWTHIQTLRPVSVWNKWENYLNYKGWKQSRLDRYSIPWIIWHLSNLMDLCIFFIFMECMHKIIVIPARYHWNNCDITEINSHLFSKWHVMLKEEQLFKTCLSIICHSAAQCLYSKRFITFNP